MTVISALRKEDDRSYMKRLEPDYTDIRRAQRSTMVLGRDGVRRQEVKCVSKMTSGDGY